MKTITTFLLALVLSVSAQASTKTYNCLGATGYITPETFTLVATDYGFTVYFKGNGYEKAKPASLITAYGTKIPAVFGATKSDTAYNGAVLLTNKNPESFFKIKDNTYKVMYGYANRNLLNGMETGAIKIAYKQTRKGEPSSNAHEWVRSYYCRMR